MKNKYWVLIIAALTVIGTFWTQTELGGKKYRTHQHKEYLSVEDTIPDVQEAINAEQISESQYNSEAVDRHRFCITFYNALGVNVNRRNFISVNHCVVCLYEIGRAHV